MSNATSAAASFLAGLLLAGAAMTAAAQDFKPGLWEIKQKPELDPQRQAQMEQMQKQMAALPPEQRKQLESMMSKNGVSMNFQGGELTLKSCVTREQADRAGIPKTEGKCEHDSKRTGDRMLVNFRCTHPASEGTNEITFLGTDHYRTRSEVRVQRDGKTEVLRSTGEARYLGADCGSLKPQPQPQAPSQGGKP
jgi:hypothetical protein